MESTNEKLENIEEWKAGYEAGYKAGYNGLEKSYYDSDATTDYKAGFDAGRKAGYETNM